MEFSQVKIVSDGLPTGTRVIVNGEALTDVISVSWSIEVDSLATATIVLSGVAVEVVGDGELRIRPLAIVSKDA